MTVGICLAASTRPRSEVDPVRSSTANASATGAIALPAIEIVRPAKSSRNCRSRSGPSRLTSVTTSSGAGTPHGTRPVGCCDRRSPGGRAAALPSRSRMSQRRACDPARGGPAGARSGRRVPRLGQRARNAEPAGATVDEERARGDRLAVQRANEAVPAWGGDDRTEERRRLERDVRTEGNDPAEDFGVVVSATATSLETAGGASSPRSNFIQANPGR